MNTTSERLIKVGLIAAMWCIIGALLVNMFNPDLALILVGLGLIMLALTVSFMIITG